MWLGQHYTNRHTAATFNGSLMWSASHRVLTAQPLPGYSKAMVHRALSCMLLCFVTNPCFTMDLSHFLFLSSSRVIGMHSLQWELQLKNCPPHRYYLQRLLRRQFFVVPFPYCMFFNTDITLVFVTPRVSPHPKTRARSSCAPEATCILIDVRWVFDSSFVGCSTDVRCVFDRFSLSRMN